MKRAKAGGGWPAIWYAFRKSREAGGLLRMYRALRAKNACKTCALGMGGQRGGMVNERGTHFEVCKKSIQAMAADMRGAIRPHFFTDFTLEKLRGFSPRELEAAGRLTEPLFAGPLDANYRPVTWDEALDRIATKLRRTAPEESFFYFSGRSSNEAGFLLQLFARLYGTNHVNNCSYYCHQASGVGLASATGSGTATIVLEDVHRCDLLFLIGANPASNHPRFMKSLLELKRHGGRIIVINPLREVGLERFRIPSDPVSLFLGSKIADEYLQPHIAGDIALLAGIAKAVLERGAMKEEYIASYTEGWGAFGTKLESLGWDTIVERSGVDRATIERIAGLYAKSRKTIFCWAMGVTHHEHGVENVQMIANLALMRGMLGSPFCGLLPLRGHSNVQGIGSVGVTPKLKDAVFERLQIEFGVTLPTHEGLDTLGCMLRADEGRMRFGLCLGGNLYGSNPDSAFAARALGKLDLAVYLSTTLNTGHAHGRGRETIILPVLARDEEPQPTTQESMFNYVRLSDGGRPRYQGPRSEVQVIADLAQRCLGGDQRRRDEETERRSAGSQQARAEGGGSQHTPPSLQGRGPGGGSQTTTAPVDWQSLRRHGRIREAIARIIPGYEKIGEIDHTKQEFQIGGRTFHDPIFATPSRRARFHAVELPPLRGTGPGELRLMTVRSEGQFNTVVYEEEDVYRGQERRDVIMMNAADIERFGFRIDQAVRVSTDTGALADILVRPIDIPPGNAAMYYPEANVLIPKVADAKSKTPAFKSVVVRVEG